MTTAAAPTTPASAGAGQPPAETPLRSVNLLARMVELLAIVPPLLTLWEVSRAPRLQFTDYWYVLLRITEGDGSLKFSGLLELQNEHPLMIPGLLYYLDAWLADGDNRVLGVLVVLIAAGTVLLLRSALPKSLPPMLRAGLVLAVSMLVFSLHGLHNFVRAMSGSAWLTANLLVVVALLLASRGRWTATYLVGLAACMSYGTAFAVWPAVAAMAMMRRARWWLRVLPLVVCAGVIVAWRLLRPAVDPGGSPADDPGTVLYSFLTVLGHVWTSDNAGVAALAGAGLLAGYAVLLTGRVAPNRWQPDLPRLWFWWALALYAVLAAGMIALARIDFGTKLGLSSRYTSLSVLASVPLLVLAAISALNATRPDAGPQHHRATRIAAVAVAAGLAGYALGAPVAATIRAELAVHPLQAVAIRAGLSDAFGATLPPANHIGPRLRVMDHYPFSAAFTLGCGGPELGSTLDDAELTPLPGSDGRYPRRPAGSVDEVTTLTDSVKVTGWATDPAEPVRCAVIVDQDGTVVGGGITGLSRPDVAAQLTGIAADVGYQLVGPVQRSHRVVVIFESGAMRWQPVTDGTGTAGRR